MRTPVCAILLFLATVNANVDTVLLRHETEEALEIAEIIAFGNRTVARYFQSVLFDESDPLGAKLRKDLSQLNRFAYALPYKWGKGLEIEFALELMSAYADLIEIKRNKREAFGKEVRRRKRESASDLDVPDLDIIVEEPEDDDYATLADDEDYTDEPEQESTDVPGPLATLILPTATASSSEVPTAPSTVQFSFNPASDAFKTPSESSSAVTQGSPGSSRSSSEREAASSLVTEAPSSSQTEVPSFLPSELPSSSQSEVSSSSKPEKPLPTIESSLSLASDTFKIPSDGLLAVTQIYPASSRSSSEPEAASSKISSLVTEAQSSSQSKVPSFSETKKPLPTAESSPSLASDVTDAYKIPSDVSAAVKQSSISSSVTEVPSSSQSELPSMPSISQSSSILPSDDINVPRLPPYLPPRLTIPNEGAHISLSPSSSAEASLGSSKASPTTIPVSSTQLPSNPSTASSVQSSTQATIIIAHSSSSAPTSTQSPSTLATKKLVTIPLKNIYVTATIKQATPRPNGPKKVAYLTVREIGEIIERVARSKEYDESRIREDLIQYVNHLDKTSGAKYMKKLTLDLIRRGVRPIRQKWQPYMFTVLRFDDRWGTRNL
uniref:Mucin-5AC n=1 Tax=Panagrellus redivivus TaxID=6233 RepID=A0A7E4VLY4_PANRE